MLSQIKQAIKSCNACGLRKFCTQTVPGAGNESAFLAFIGEAPGVQEDRDGKPFVGDAGKFLNHLLERMGLEREQVFIDNIIHCRPRGNRDPVATEVRACSHWLDETLETVNPKIIVCLGVFSTRHITGVHDTMEHLHGRPIVMDGKVVLPAYHPAAGFHDTSLLRHIYDDFTVLKKLINGVEPESLLVKDEYPNPRYEVLEDPRKIKELLSEPRIAMDTELTADDRLWSMQVSVKPGEAYFIPARLIPRVPFTKRTEVTVHNFLHEAKYLEVPKFLDTMVLAYVLDHPQGLKELASRLCGMKMRSYTEVVRPYRRDKALTYLKLAQAMEWSRPIPYDVMEWSKKLGKPVIRETKPKHIKYKIKDRIEKAETDPEFDPYAKWFEIDERERAEVESVLGVMKDADLSDAPYDEAVEYASRDPDATLRVREKMLAEIEECRLSYILKQVDQPTLPILRYMMDRGTVVDIPFLRGLSKEYFEKMVDAAARAADVVGYPFNPNSGDQVAEVVFKKLGYKPTKWTETGKPSTDDQELKKIQVAVPNGRDTKMELHPVIQPILDYRGALKLKSTYADALIRFAEIDEEGEPRVHTNLKPTRTSTGRLASDSPNLQNQPVRTDDGKKIRKAFVAPRGGTLLAPDYSGQEMRVAAHVSQDPVMLEVFRRNGDIHTETAADVFGVPLEVAKEWKYRYPIKRVGFGVLYMIGEQGLHDVFIEEGVEGWSVADCGRLIEDWYRRFKKVKDMQYEAIAFARRKGYIEDMFGRRRWVPEVACPIKKVQAAGERQTGNMIIQSPSATITKRGMIEPWRGLYRWSGELLPVLQIHDEVLYELLKPELLMDVARWMKHVMENVVSLSVPLKVDVKAGERWGGMEELELS